MSTTLTPGERSVLGCLRAFGPATSAWIAEEIGYSLGFTKRALKVLRLCGLATYSARGGWVGQK